jgi:hypothetical protein
LLKIRRIKRQFSKNMTEKLYALNIGLTKDNDEMNKNMSGRKIGIGHILRELTLDTADFQLLYCLYRCLLFNGAIGLCNCASRWHSFDKK